MTLLTERELERYRDLRVSNLEPSPHSCFKASTIERLILAESRLTENGYGLPCYAALQYHTRDINLMTLAKELCISYDTLVKMFGHYGIPRLSASETKIRQYKDPKFRRKMAESKRKSMKKLNDKTRGSSITREKVVKAYGVLATRKPFENWRDLIGRVSENEDIPEETVRLYLEGLFREKY